MVFYLGHKIDNLVEEKIRLGRNKTKSWVYGYDDEYDIVIISKDGTLGTIYEISGIKIGLPEPPSDRKQIINWDKTPGNQKFKHVPLPKGLNENTQRNLEYKDYIEEEIKRRRDGVFVYIKGEIVYLTGLSYYLYQWCRLDDGYPNFRVAQNELMIFWDACKADPRSYGICYVKNRRFGWSTICDAELIYSSTQYRNKKLGIVSKTNGDAKEMFDIAFDIFKRLPPFFQPTWDKQTTSRIIMKKPKKDSGSDIEEGIDSYVRYYATALNSMDGGKKVFRSAVDECGKFPKEVAFNKYWKVIKTSHRQGSRIVGKAMVGSTVNSKKKGGAEFEDIYKQSNQLKRNQNGQTSSGLYQLFIPAYLGFEGKYDQYGFSIVENPKERTLTDEGIYTTIGSKEYLQNEAKALEKNPEDLNEQLRQFPFTEKDAFRDESGDCEFDIIKLTEQEDYNKDELDEVYNGEDVLGNNDIERGNFTWKNGVQDTEVIWNPSPDGRFWIRKGCHPPTEFRNAKEKLFKNGVLAWSPIGGHLGAFGVDPYNRDKSADGRGSKGSIHLSTMTNTSSLPNDAFIIEYIDRAKKVTIFFEEVIMAMVYYSIPMLSELSNEAFLQYVSDRGYRHYSLNNPFKPYHELNPTEKKLGGAPAQNAKIADQQFYAIESYIVDYVGVAQDNRNRPKGEMGNMPFTRTLKQWKEVDLADRTKYDAYISSSLSRLACQRRVIKKEVDTKPVRNPFKKYDNKGIISEAI
jgi:hypothetical protein